MAKTAPLKNANAPKIVGHGGARQGAGRPRGPASDEAYRYSVARADTQEAVARIKKIQAEKAHADLLERMGSLVDAGEVEGLMSDFVDVVLSFLAPLPDRLGRDCGLPAEAIDLLSAEVDNLRAELHGLLHRKFG